jgi:2'-5' RNA ligase
MRLAANGFRVDARDYVPHVTLLRAARSAPAAIETQPLMWRVRHIVLAESIHESGRLMYRPLRQFMLRR